MLQGKNLSPPSMNVIGCGYITGVGNVLGDDGELEGVKHQVLVKRQDFVMTIQYVSRIQSVMMT